MSFFLTTFATQMKKDYLYIVFSILLSAFQLSANAQTVTYSDSVEISLLTCSPGKEIWSHYGHTAIRYNDYQNGNDLAINYGLFSPSQPSLFSVLSLDWRITVLALSQWEHSLNNINTKDEELLNKN